MWECDLWRPIPGNSEYLEGVRLGGEGREHEKPGSSTQGAHYIQQLSYCTEWKVNSD